MMEHVKHLEKKYLKVFNKRKISVSPILVQIYFHIVARIIFNFREEYF